LIWMCHQSTVTGSAAADGATDSTGPELAGGALLVPGLAPPLHAPARSATTPTRVVTRRWDRINWPPL
jgi:hypothetical protein